MPPEVLNAMEVIYAYTRGDMDGRMGKIADAYARGRKRASWRFEGHPETVRLQTQAITAGLEKREEFRE